MLTPAAITIITVEGVATAVEVLVEDIVVAILVVDPAEEEDTVAVILVVDPAEEDTVAETLADTVVGVTPVAALGERME